jgi:hypothetical protein
VNVRCAAQRRPAAPAPAADELPAAAAAAAADGATFLGTTPAVAGTTCAGLVMRRV